MADMSEINLPLIGADRVTGWKPVPQVTAPQVTAPHLPPVPQVTPRSLDVVWFQVAGTICNLRCHHCFISCAPENDKFGFLQFDTFKTYLDESIELGVKEYYFTGGEPFANPRLLDMLDLALKAGPTTSLLYSSDAADE